MAVVASTSLSYLLGTTQQLSEWKERSTAQTERKREGDGEETEGGGRRERLGEGRTEGGVEGE